MQRNKYFKLNPIELAIACHLSSSENHRQPDKIHHAKPGLSKRLTFFVLRADQFLLVSTQRSNVECDWSAANDETLCWFSGGTLQSRSQQTHSTVTLLAKFLGLSTSVPFAHAV